MNLKNRLKIHLFSAGLESIGTGLVYSGCIGAVYKRAKNNLIILAKLVDVYAMRCVNTGREGISPTAKPTDTMKSYITITYTTGIYERSDSFIRPRYCRKPTYIGAARMIARHLGCLPCDVSVIRVELIGYAV